MQRTPYDLYNTLLKPITPIVTQMHLDGVKLDAPYIESLIPKYKKELQKVTQKMFSEVGCRFNYRKDADLIYVLKNKLGLELTEKTDKGNISTNKNTLEKLSEQNKSVSAILECRHLDKMISTYLSGPLENIMPNGRVRPGWNILGTETGRWSSSKPFAIQTIPRLKEIKRIVVPQKGYVFVVVDYSQAELRILAYYSGDEVMLQGARENKDLHAFSTAMFFECSPDDVINGRKSSDKKEALFWDERRQIGKSGNFLLVYRGSEYALAHHLGISITQAKKYFKAFHKNAFKVMEWSNNVIKQLKEMGELTSCYGRKRRFPLYQFLSEEDKKDAHKEAPNALIQGTSVDFCSYSIIELVKNLKKEGLYGIERKERVIPVAQVHDSVLLEVPEHLVDGLIPLIVESLEKPKEPVTIPMKVDVEIGYNWADVGEYRKVS